MRRRSWLLMVLLVAPTALARNATRLAEFPGWWFDAEQGDGFFVAREDDSVRLATATASAKFASLGQTFDAADFRGKRLRFAAESRTEGVDGWMGLWLRVDSSVPGVPLFHDASEFSSPGSPAWAEVAVVVDIPEEAQRIHIGLGQQGPGRSWFRSVSLTTVGRHVSLTRREGTDGLRDGDFESPTLLGWPMSGEGRNDYAAELVMDVRHSGAKALRLTALPGADLTKYGSATQSFNAKPYWGKRMRATLWMRSQGVARRGDFWVRCRAADSPADGLGLAGGKSWVDPQSEWQPHEVVFDVPSTCAQVQFGMGLQGPGTLWADDAGFEVVSRDVPLRSGAPLHPRNLKLKGGGRDSREGAP